MFAKLKKKLEEGESGGPERLAFSPRKLPGGAVAVRSPPADGTQHQAQHDAGDSTREAGTRQEEVRKKDADRKKEDVKPFSVENIDLHPTSLPPHLLSSLTQETVNQDLLKRITLQQQELDRLVSQVQETEKAHEKERERWGEEMNNKVAEKEKEIQALQSRFDKADSKVTELELQVIELQMEKTDTEQRLEGERQRLQGRLEEMEREREEINREMEERLADLQRKVAEKDELLADRDFQISELTSQVEKLETSKMDSIDQLVTLSQDEALRKLQNEVIDLEKRLRTRTMEIEMTRINAESQMKWKEEQLEEGVARQQSLLAAQKELRTQLGEKRGEIQELQRELERGRKELEKREGEVTDLSRKLEEAGCRTEQLEQQVEEQLSSHARHLQEVTSQKDTRITELSKALEELQGELLGSEMVDHNSLEKSALDYASVSTQTDPPQEEEREVKSLPAVLPINSCPEDSINGMIRTDGEEEKTGDLKTGDPATMASHGLIEELQLLRQEQLRLQEEVSEKNKLVRFQQQKIMDMRKALNKELQRSQSSQNLPDPLNSSHFPHTTSSPNFSWQKSHDKSPTPPPGGPITSCNDVNLQYLKHVVIKFLCSREDEGSQLIRAVSTLLEFSPREEKFVRDYFDYRMSWFGTMPQSLYSPVQKVTFNRHT